MSSIWMTHSMNGTDDKYEDGDGDDVNDDK